MYFFLSITTKQFVLLTDLKSRRCSSTSLRLLRSEKPETGVDRILLDAELRTTFISYVSFGESSSAPPCTSNRKAFFENVSPTTHHRWTKELQWTVSAFTCKTSNNANVVGVLRVTFMARENLVLHGLNYHKVIKSLHRFQSMEHPLPGLPTGNDDDDMPAMNSVSAKVDVGGSTLEGAPTT
ncbi:hypothetical protein IGI04_005987 [Brassica rapa subsp. trilocularis]|uniref:Uncharacterized protein n=1 Tax=Brassica rapa subsp. trilocularis TaxID=1813537 RepID=A0ABQ7NFJ2_BRACM|nr:hypothetical protein IGI04_005987 [Brassica rapa subsp. trilocularis]